MKTVHVTQNPYEINKYWTLNVTLVIKSPTASTGDVRDAGSIPGSGRFPGEGHDNPLRYSCLENPKDRGAVWINSY